MSGRHTGVARRGSVLVMTVATALGLWLGVSAPEVSPVAAPVPAAQVGTPADTAAVVPAPVVPAPVVPAPQPAVRGPQRGGRR
jgi:hypothetical protein